jgi:hypothetical protein
MCQEFQQTSATESCFPALAPHFPGQIFFGDHVIGTKIGRAYDKTIEAFTIVLARKTNNQGSSLPRCESRYRPLIRS